MPLCVTVIHKCLEECSCITVAEEIVLCTAEESISAHLKPFQVLGKLGLFWFLYV